MKDYVLITGASTGIGYELAKIYANEGNSLILVARNREKLERVYEELNSEKIEVKILDADISQKIGVKKIIEYVENNKLNITILINNAGIGSFGDFKDISYDSDEELIDLNIKALTGLTKYFLPKMIEERAGGILNVASTAAFCAGPRMAIYYATKAYVLSLTESIYEEVKEYGIKVSCLCPGPVKTSFQNKAGIMKSDKAKKYLMDSDIVAKIAYKGFNKGKVIIIPGAKNKLLVLGNKILPRNISRKIIYKTNK